MAMTVTYNGKELPISSDDAEDLLAAFFKGEPGVMQFDAEGGGTTYVAYGPGIPVVFESTDD
ncbi:hypothetical protein [Microbacterium sp. 1P10AE]|uniref:hypothetical protein n=1 Tax=Microbacterium sp. 1P10AE TaxID=3132286 RepID=UPI0039A0CE8E